MRYLLIVAVFGAMCTAQESHARELIVQKHFRAPEITNICASSRIDMEGLANGGPVGAPSLPIQPVHILLPYRTEGHRVTIVRGEKIRVPGTYRVQTVQRSFPLGKPQKARPTAPDSSIYSSAAPYPDSPFSEVGVQSKKGYEMLIVTLHPVEYVPAEGTLCYYKDLAVVVSTDEARSRDDAALPPDPRAREEIARAVDNPELLSTYPVKRAPTSRGTHLDPGSYRHVIVTAEALAPAFGPLVSHRAAGGIDSTIVTMEWICATYDGTRPFGPPDDQTRLRNFVKDAYENWGTEYVLLGGDKDLIPPRKLNVRTQDPDHLEYSAPMPSDMYYGCLDGTFDADADGRYGEDPARCALGVDEADLFAEVYIGRAAAPDIDAASRFVAKLIAHENSRSDSLRRAYMVGEYLSFGGDSEFAKAGLEEVRLGSQAHGYSTAGFAQFPFFETRTLYDRDRRPDHFWPSGEIIDIMNGGVHILNSLAHAARSATMKINSNDVESLTSEDYFFVYSQGCHAGEFDTPYPCFAQVATTAERAAFAAIMNAREGWGAPNTTDGPSHRYNREFWDAFFAEGVPQLGKMNQDSKEDNAYRVNEPYMRWCMYGLNLFGDPWTKLLGNSPRGFLFLEAGHLAAPAELCVMLLDANLNTDSAAAESVVVNAASASESAPEAFTLTETGPDSGVFYGCIAVASGSPAPDGTLQAAHGDPVTVTYADADDGSGSPAIAAETAFADFEPPAIGSVSVEAGCTRARIGWSTDEGARGRVRYGTEPGDLSHEAGPGEAGTAHSLFLEGLTPETTYYYEVLATDEAGNEAADGGGGAPRSFVTGPEEYRYVSEAGSDGSDGSLSAPWATIGRAISTVEPDALCPPLILVSEGTYRERITMREHARLYGGYDPVDWTQDVGAHQTVIEPPPGEEGSVVTIEALRGDDLILSGFTIRNGSAVKYGGGIYCNEAEPTLSSLTVTDNATGTDKGRGDEQGPDGGGGGIYCGFSSPLITGCTIRENTAAHNSGGGLLFYCSSAHLLDSVIEGNEAFGGGGVGLYSSSPRIAGTIVTGNHATQGGGIESWHYSFPELVNDVISANDADRGGALVLGDGSAASLVNNTIAHNEATFGAVAKGDPSELSPAQISNSIAWENTTRFGSHMTGVAREITYSCLQWSQSGAGNIFVDPAFAGGEPFDYGLSAGSPCIDRGNSDAVPAWATTDAAGAPRFTDDPDTPDGGAGSYPIVDMGAYEHHAEVAVTVELSPTIATGASPDTLTRCVTFELFDSREPLDPVVLSRDIAFAVESGSPAVGTALLRVPPGDYVCMTAVDPLHTLRRECIPFRIDDRRYTADFTGDPASGGDWLVGGDLNADGVIDILDYALFSAEYAADYGTGDTPCGTDSPHADISGDGLATLADFTFIQINFMKVSESECSGEYAAKGTRGIAVDEASRLLSGSAARADLDGDGMLDEADLRAATGYLAVQAR